MNKIFEEYAKLLYEFKDTLEHVKLLRFYENQLVYYVAKLYEI